MYRGQFENDPPRLWGNKAALEKWIEKSYPGCQIIAGLGEGMYLFKFGGNIVGVVKNE